MHLGDDLELILDGGDLLLRCWLRSSEAEERHCEIGVLIDKGRRGDCFVLGLFGALRSDGMDKITSRWCWGKLQWFSAHSPGKNDDVRIPFGKVKQASWFKELLDPPSWIYSWRSASQHVLGRRSRVRITTGKYRRSGFRGAAFKLFKLS